MRFFSGSRDMSKKKGAASERFKQELMAKNNKSGLAKEDPNAVYKRQIEARMAKLMEDILLGKKSNPNKLPGTKDSSDTPKEVSKGTLMMLRVLSERREQKERKAVVKRERQYKADERAKIQAMKTAALQAEELIRQKEAEYAAQQASHNTNFWGAPIDENKGWW